MENVDCEEIKQKKDVIVKALFRKHFPDFKKGYYSMTKQLSKQNFAKNINLTFAFLENCFELYTLTFQTPS